ncbi:NUDIX domain-containing protein [Streptococcus fryi]
MRFKTKSAVFLVIKKDDSILLQKRQNTGFMDGYYDFAVSGHVEKGESLTQAVIREAWEECRITVDKTQLKLFTILHRQTADDCYYYFYFVLDVTDWANCDIQIGEVDKIAELRWFERTNLPSNLLDYNEVALVNLDSQNSLSELGFE